MRFTFRLACLASFILAIASVSWDPIRLDSKSATLKYRSPSEHHKVIVESDQADLLRSLLQEGASLIEDYGSFMLLKVGGPTVERLSAEGAPELQVCDFMNLILLRAGVFDTTATELAEAAPEGDQQLHIVQMVGPIKDEWIDQLSSNVELISYIPNNAYLVRAGKDSISALREDLPFIQWSGAFKPDFKIAPELRLAADQEVTVTVQLLDGDSLQEDLQKLIWLSDQVISGPTRVLKYTNLRVRIRAERLADAAQLSSTLWIEPWREIELMDEVQSQIIAGNMAGNFLSGPGYLDWLKSKGLAQTSDFVVDLADSGIDRGIIDPDLLHPDFLDGAGAPRIAYARYVGGPGRDGEANDTAGHGTIDASILGGYNAESRFPYVDERGYRFGLGVHPFIRIGVTKIFDPDFTQPDFVQMVDMMYRDGARISSNSWGANTNVYSLDSQIYDALVRDAQPNNPGNQEMCIIFAAGNRGPGGNISSPATAKNVIAVGASENLRPAGTDGCRVGAEGADDMNSVAAFSSGGPVQDGRVKPDLLAPGTHVQGAQSQDPDFDAKLICGPRDYPPGQSLYTWSSGTSQATPAVAGAAALVRQYFQQSTGNPPSPAMIKAYLLNSTTYLTGNRAADSLPSNNQGWGLLNLNRAFDGTPRILIDQTKLLSSTGQVYTVRGRISDPTKPFRVTLAWTDAPAQAVAMNPAINNLDLQVELGGKIYLGNNFNGPVSIEGGRADQLNNVESVWLPEGASGEFTIRVIAANIAGDGVPGNGDPTDQDFALVAYNAQLMPGGDPIDFPPRLALRFPVGGEKLMAGNLVRISWEASDDKGIQSQKIELSTDGGITYLLITSLDGSARSFDWKVPDLPTKSARIRVTAFDGVNLPISVSSPGDFEIVLGPPDTIPPRVAVLAPKDDDVIAGGSSFEVRWTESDNVGVVRRVLEFSTDGGDTFQEIASITAPSIAPEQRYTWHVPASASSSKGKIRITAYDGRGNSSLALSAGKFQIWAMPIISEVGYKKLEDGRGELMVAGRNFRLDQTAVYVNGVKLKSLKFFEAHRAQDGTYRRVYSYDRKLEKRLPLGVRVTIFVKLLQTGQTSPPFTYKRKNG